MIISGPVHQGRSGNGVGRAAVSARPLRAVRGGSTQRGEPSRKLDWMGRRMMRPAGSAIRPRIQTSRDRTEAAFGGPGVGHGRQVARRVHVAANGVGRLGGLARFRFRARCVPVREQTAVVGPLTVDALLRLSQDLILSGGMVMSRRPAWTEHRVFKTDVLDIVRHLGGDVLTTDFVHDGDQVLDTALVSAFSRTGPHPAGAVEDHPPDGGVSRVRRFSLRRLPSSSYQVSASTLMLECTVT